MRGVSKTLVGVLALFLLAVGLAACGGGDSSSSTSAEAENSASAQKAAKHGDEGGAGSDAEGKAGKSTESKSKSTAAEDRAEARSFVPRHHNDSGGGSQQFRVKGGDNSVQEFGEEADSAELAAATTALHNFLDARAEGNWAAACEYIAKEVAESFEKLASQAQQLEGSSCAGVLQTLTNPAAKQSLKAEAKKANVGSLRTEGERSFAIYTGLGGAILAVPMVKEGGDWKVASLAGTPLN